MLCELNVVMWSEGSSLLRFCQVMLICAFEKLAVTLKDLCKLTGEWFFAPIHLAGKLQFAIYFIKVSTSYF